MALMKTSNPALNVNSFRVDQAVSGEAMTLTGSWSRFFHASTSDEVLPLMGIGLVGGLVVAMVTIFKKEWSPITAPIYSLLEGLALGGISAMFEHRYPGIAIQAVGLTFGTLFVLLIAYHSRVIRVTEKFKLGVVAATGGIAVFYLVQFVLGFFGVRFTAINGSGLLGIGFSVVVVIVAALNLVLDFDFIESGVSAGAPKYMEWYGAFGLIVTLVWLYLEILRLLSKINGRR
jgi:uncharacterized YccA/Bax inhibitor family protein